MPRLSEPERWIQVVPPKHSDRAAFIGARPLGTGYAVSTKIIGQRSGERAEVLSLSKAQRDQLIIDLGGTP